MDVARCSVRHIDNLVAAHTLAMELRDTVLTVSTMRVTLLNAQLRGELTKVVHARLFRMLIVNRLQTFYLIKLWRIYRKHFWMMVSHVLLR